MRIVAAKQLREALAQARGVGIVEEPFEMGGLPMVVRSLRPDEHEAILADCEGMDDLVYLHTLQRAHVSRGLVEVAGLDLREVDFVEDETTDEKGRTKKVRVERHRWVADNVLTTWGRESLYTAYRKVGDAIQKAEAKAAEGVTFLVPDESEEDRSRRLIGEAKEVLGELPPLVRRRVLDDYGLMEQSTAAENKNAQETLDAVAREQAAKEAEEAQGVTAEAPAEEAPVDVSTLRRGLAQVQQVPPSPPPRQPLNRVVDVSPDLGPPAPVMASPVPPQASPGPSVSRRSAELAAQAEAAERELGLLPVAPVASQGAPPVPLGVPRGEPVELRGRAPVDPAKAAQAAASIIETQPAAGINPFFRPPGH
jgi:hypothetical protein